MNLLICHDLKFFGDAMARWLEESKKVNVVGVVTDPSARGEAAKGQAVDAELLTPRLLADYLASESGREKINQHSSRRVLLVPERTTRAEALARLYGFDGVVEERDLDGPLEGFVEQLERIVSAPSGGATEPDLIDVYTSVIDSRIIATMDAVDERIVNLVAEGLSDKQIGSALGLSPQTIRNRVSRMLNDSGLRNRTELAVQFVRNHPDVMGKGAI
jgi:DNA-binding CsgD family transcriptional regulator